MGRGSAAERRETKEDRDEGERRRKRNQACFSSPGGSYRLIQRLGERRAAGGGDLSAHRVGVGLAAAAGAFQAVVTPLAKFEAPQGGKVAAEAGHEEGEEAHGSPAGAAGPRPAGAGVVGAGVLVVGGAVVEETLDAAEASPVVEEALGGAEAALVAEPAGGQAAGGRAAGALAPPALLADEEVPGVQAGLLHRPLQRRLLRLQLAGPGLRPDERVARVGRRQAAQEALVGGGGALGHGAGRAGMAHGLLQGWHLVLLAVAAVQVREGGRHQAVLRPLLLVRWLRQGRVGAGLLEAGSRPLHVVVAGTDGADLVNGQDLLEVLGGWVHRLVAAELSHTGRELHFQEQRDPAASGHI